MENNKEWEILSAEFVDAIKTARNGPTHAEIYSLACPIFRELVELREKIKKEKEPYE